MDVWSKALNSLYVTIGGALVIALLAALVGPFFVDWTAYRATFETEASRLLGHQVVVAGKTDARLLPTPMLTFDDVRVGDEDGPSLRVKNFQTRIELMPLFSGEVRIIDMTLDEPEVSVAIQEDGTLDWIAQKVEPDAQDLSFVFDAVSIRRGRFILDDRRNDRQMILDDVNASLSARSLAGPYKIEGSGLFDGVRYSAIVATGVMDDQGLRSKVSLLSAAHPVTLALDGQINRTENQLRYNGRFDLKGLPMGAHQTSSNPEPDWTSRGSFDMTADGFRVADFSVTFGSEDEADAYSLSGAGSLSYAGRPRLDAVLTSRQIDLDRVLGGGPDDPVDVAGVLSFLGEKTRTFAWPRIDGKIGFDVPGIVVAGDLIQGMQFDLSLTDDQVIVDTAEGRLPGGTDLRLSGLAVSDTFLFEGPMRLSTNQPDVLLNWLGLPVEQGLTGRPKDPLNVEGTLSLGQSEWTLDDFTLKSGATALKGRIHHAAGPEKMLDLDVQTKSVRLDLLTTLGHLLKGDETNGTVEKTGSVKAVFKAGEITSDQVTASGVDIAVAYNGTDLSFERLKISDLAGTSLSGGGQLRSLFSEPRGTMSLDIKARRFSGTIAFLEAAGLSGPIVDRLRIAEPALRDIDLSLSANAEAEAGETRLTGQVRGQVGETEVSLDAFAQGGFAKLVDADWAISADMANPRSLPLLRQLGLDVVPVEPGGASSATLAFDGVPSDGGALKADLAFGSVALALDGTASLQQGDPGFDGTISLRGPDILPLAFTLGQILPGYAAMSLPSDLTAGVALDGYKFTFSGIKGRLADQEVAGVLEADFSREQPKLSGRFEVPVANLAVLGSSLLGDGLSFTPLSDPVWPEAVFGDGLAGAVTLDLDLKADQLIVTETQRLANVELEMRYRPASLSPASLSLVLAQSSFAGGSLTGQIQIDRPDAALRTDMQMQLTGARAEELLWSSSQTERPLVEAGLTISAQLSSEGRSLSGLIANLGGEGTFNLADGILQQLNPSAFGLVMRAVDGGVEIDDQRLQRLFSGHLDSGSLQFSRGSGTFSVSNGVLRSRNVSFDTKERATTFASGQLDLRDLTLESTWTLSVDSGVDAVAGGRPEVSLVFSGDARQPERSIDLSTFVGFLTIRAFEQEVQEIERLQDDILERDYLSRQLRRIKQERDRHVSVRGPEVEDGVPLPETVETLSGEEQGGGVQSDAQQQNGTSDQSSDLSNEQGGGVADPVSERPVTDTRTTDNPVQPSSRPVPPVTQRSEPTGRRSLPDQTREQANESSNGQDSFEQLIRGALDNVDDLLDPLSSADPLSPPSDTSLPPLDEPIEISPLN